MDIQQFLQENENVSEDFLLEKGEEYILKADDKHERGLTVRFNNDKSYDVTYWFEDPEKAYPIEVIVDGKSVAKDAKEIKLKYHPKIDK